MPLILALVKFYATVSQAQTPSTAGPKFIKDGAAGSELNLWEISYFAKDYLPTCGISLEIEGSNYWSNSLECEPAMVAYNHTSLQVSVYDTSGTLSTQAFGTGKELCMCFGLQHYESGLLDICLLVGADAEIRERESETGVVAVGIQSPETNRGKMLPLCNEGAASSTGGNAGTQTTGFVNATSTPAGNFGGSKTTSSSSTAIDTSTHAPSTSSSNDRKSGLSTDGIIGLAVGLPGAIVAIATMIIYIRRRSAHRYNVPYH